MYWRPNVDSSKVDHLLNSEGVTLKDILSEDGVINEVQVYNEKLLNYLVIPEHISEMLNILISKPEPNGDGILFFSEQNVVSEILSSYVNIIYSTLSNNPDYMAILFKPFIISCHNDENQTGEPVNSVTCSLIFKVAKILCQQSSDKLLCFFMSIDGILDQFVNNIESNSVSEFLIKCIQSFQPNHVLMNYLKWLSNEDITGKLLAKIQPDTENQVCIKSMQCLFELLSAVKTTKEENSLLSDLQNSRVVTHILSVMLGASASKMSMISSGLEFIKSIFEFPEKQCLSSFTSPVFQIYKKTSINPQDIQDNQNIYSPIIECLITKFSDFKGILDDTSELSKIRILTAYGGEIVGPLGPHRLALIDLIHHLLMLEQSRIYVEFINSDIISTLLKLFFEFHLNTFLHRFVTEIVNKLINFASDCFNDFDRLNENNSVADKILHELIIKQDLLNRIVSSWNNNMTSVPGTSKMIRNTHRPFLKEIANTIEKQSYNLVRVIDKNTLKIWKTFAETKLAEENKKNIIKKNMSYPDSSSEGESAVEVIEDFGNEDILKIYEDCIQQEMTYNFPDYNYKPIFIPEKSSMESELNSNPLTGFLLSTQEDIDNAENFEAVCNVMLTTKMPCENSIEPNEYIANDMDYNLTNEVENIDELYENNYHKSSNLQTNVIDRVFREAYKEMSQPSKHHEIKILENRSSFNHQTDGVNNRFQFRTSTGLPVLKKEKQSWKSNPTNIERAGDNIIVGSTIVPCLKFDDINGKKEKSKPLILPNQVSQTLYDDKETLSGSSFSIDEDNEEETPLSSTARYIPNERLSEFSDESEDEDIPLSSRLEKGQSKLSENLSELDSRLNDKTWSNPSNIQSPEEDDVEFDTVQDVTPDLVITHCNSFPHVATIITNNTEKEELITSDSISQNTSTISADELSVKSSEAQPTPGVVNIDIFEIENPFSPKLIRHTIHNTNKDTGLNKARLFESSKCLTLSSSKKSNNIDFKQCSTLTPRHTFSSILCPLPWTSFQKVNRSISAPFKLNVNNDSNTLGLHNSDTDSAQLLVNGLGEADSPNINPVD